MRSVRRAGARMLLASTCGALFPCGEVLAADLVGTPSPQPITGGEAAQVCQWPDTVAVLGADTLCTGTLVHPRVVVFAAHCGGGEKLVLFGERLDLETTRVVETDRCLVNPGYGGTEDAGRDWAFCLLSASIDDLPVTPPLYGCELDLLESGLEVVIAGFGGTDPQTGAGIKRWAATRVVEVAENTMVVGGEGVSACSGDSGGSALVQLDDGSWRALSMVSRGPECGEPSTHALMHPAVPWIEQNAGVDITPCHEVDGAWSPTPACTGFFAGGQAPSGEWATWCAGTPASGPAETCGPAFGADDEEEDAPTAPADAEDAGDGGGGCSVPNDPRSAASLLVLVVLLTSSVRRTSRS